MRISILLDYWFWDLYNEIWKVRLFRDGRVLEEMRLLAEEVFSVCPKDQHYAKGSNPITIIT